MTVAFSGPLFDGRAQKELNLGAEAAERELAVAVRDRVREEIARRARVRTGYYESRVRVDNTTGGRVVRASGVIYDDWLQRGGWRGSSFRGYQQWDRAGSDVESRATAVVEQVLKPYIERMR